MVGSSGKAVERFAPEVARARSRPALICGAVEVPANIAATSPDMVAVVAGRAAAVGHVHQVDAGARLEQLHGELVLAAVAAGGVVERRVRLPRVLDELLQGLHRQRRVHRQHELVGHQARHRRQVLQRVERHAPYRCGLMAIRLSAARISV